MNKEEKLMDKTISASDEATKEIIKHKNVLVKKYDSFIKNVPPKVNLDKFIKANKVVKMTGVVIDFSSIPVA